MRKSAVLIIGIFVCLQALSFAYAQNARLINGCSQLTAQINQAIRKLNPQAHVGIAIKSMRYGDTLYKKNDKSLFVPASTLKIMTAEAALLYLGLDFTFPTRFLTDATSLHNGVLNGNLYLVNSGDPTLTYFDLAELMASLKARNIREITGNIYIDNTAYDNITHGPGWLWNDKKYCYGAPISASIINHNCLSYRPNTVNLSWAAANILDPRSYYPVFRSSNLNKTKSSKTCYVNLGGGQGDTLAISECIGKGNYSYNASSVIRDIMQYNKTLLQDLFNRSNIRIDGIIKPGIASPSFVELARHESKPLRLLVSDMLKMSDNIIAGSVFKKMGEIYTKRPGTWENGGIAVARILSKQAALDIWRMSIIDGSGLSRYNQITPAQMLKVLDFTFHNDATNYAFVSALPIAGVDGTLKRRMRNIPWRVRAKTGTLKGVVSLAGYAMSADKEPIAFVIMINGQNGSIWQYRQLEDKVMYYLTHYVR